MREMKVTGIGRLLQALLLLFFAAAVVSACLLLAAGRGLRTVVCSWLPLLLESRYRLRVMYSEGLRQLLNTTFQ